MKNLLLTVALGLGVATPGTILAGSDVMLHELTPGTRLILHQPVGIRLGSATAYFQGGSVVSATELDEYYPHCALLVRAVSATSQTVPASSFRITRVFYHEEEHSGLPRIRVAGLNIGIGGVASEGYTTYYFYTRMILEDNAHPQVMYLECGHLPRKHLYRIARGR